MKTKFLFAVALAASSVVFAQKKEVKELEKAIKSGSYAQARNLAASTEALEAQMDEKTKLKFTYCQVFFQQFLELIVSFRSFIH